MKQKLGPKKTRRIEQIIGKPVRAAYTRGGWEHFWAEVWPADVKSVSQEDYFAGRKVVFVNWKTGEIDGEL